MDVGDNIAHGFVKLTHLHVGHISAHRFSSFKPWSLAYKQQQHFRFVSLATSSAATTRPMFTKNGVPT